MIKVWKRPEDYKKKWPKQKQMFIFGQNDVHWTSRGIYLALFHGEWNKYKEGIWKTPCCNKEIMRAEDVLYWMYEDEFPVPGENMENK